MIPARWKLGAAVALLFWVCLAGYWLQTVVEEAKQAEVLREQIRVNAAEQDRINGIARATEAEAAADRLKNADINRQWSKIRDDKSRPACPLDDRTIRLLRDATGS